MNPKLITFLTTTGWSILKVVSVAAFTILVWTWKTSADVTTGKLTEAQRYSNMENVVKQLAAAVEKQGVILEKMQNQIDQTADHEKRLVKVENRVENHLQEDVKTQREIAQLEAIVRNIK